MKQNALLLLLFLWIFPESISADIKHVELPDSLKIQLFFDEGRAFFSEGSYPEALHAFQQSLKLGEKYFASDHPFLRILNNALGITSRNMGDLNRAINYYLAIEQLYLADEHPNQVALARLYSNIGNVYTSKLNYGKALEYFHRSVEIYRNHPGEADDRMAIFYYNIANNYYLLNQFVRALEITDQYMHMADSESRLLFLDLRAASLKELSRKDEALGAYRKAVAYAREIYPETDRRVIFEYITLTNFLISTHQFDEAFKILNQVADLLSRSDLKEGTEVALYYKTRGSWYRSVSVASGDLETFRRQKADHMTQALIHYENALKALGTDPEKLEAREAGGSQSLTQSIELLQLMADTHLEISETFAKDGDRRQIKQSTLKALEYYQSASRFIQQSRREISSDEHKIILSGLQESVYRKMVGAAWSAYDRDHDPQVAALAFKSAEQLKATALFDRLSDQFARENSLIPDSLDIREKALNFEITRQREQLYQLKRSDNASEAEVTRVDSTLFDLNRQRDELTRTLESEYPDYYQMKYTQEGISVDDIRNRLKGDEVLLEYLLDEDSPRPELFLFAITRDSLAFHRIEADTTFLRSIDTVYHFLSGSDFLFTRNSDALAFCTAAHTLYQKLFSSVSELINNRKILVVPDGKLNYIPFDALLTQMPDTTRPVVFNKLPYLIHQHNIRYSYSANLRYRFESLTRKASRRLLLFSPEYKSDTIEFDNEKLVLMPLPGIIEETKRISRMIKSSLFSGSEATEKNFRERYEDYDILHLAMHAFINDSMPAFSRFAFAQPGEAEVLNDGWLNTADIYNLNLNARLAVLSACNTGSGNIRKGEGVMSLARGFIYAGCPAIVMTLWSVEDHAGTHIMSAFYKYMKSGMATDEALRKAKLTYLNGANGRMAHPHYWLGYVSIGDTNPLFSRFDLYFFVLLFFVLVAIATEQLYRKRKRRRKPVIQR